MKKKIIIPLALISIASFSLVGCTDNNTKSEDNDDDKVIAGVFNDLKSETNDKYDEDKDDDKDDDKIIVFEDTKEDKLKTFDENVKLKYPSSWEKATVQGSTVYYIDDTASSINLVKESLRGYSEDEYINSSIDTVKESFDTKSVLMKEIELNGYEGYSLTYEADMQGQTIKLVQPTIFHDGYAYIFTIGGFPKDLDNQLDEVMSILDTIEFD